MAYFPTGGSIVLYGGNAQNRDLQDTWVWDGNDWRELSPPGPTPGPRREHAMCYHPGLGMVLLSGGRDGNNFPQDVWGWDGVSWRILAYPDGNLPQAQTSMAYDPLRDVVVAFGSSKTLEWNGSGRWSRRHTPTVPGPGSTSAMAFDPGLGRMLLYTLGTTWSYDGIDWRQEATTGSPPQRLNTAMVYDSAHGAAILFGGYWGTEFNDTWAWDGTGWSQQVAGNPPAPRSWHAMAYDAARQEVVMFSGTNAAADTWIKNPTFGTPASVTTFGSGCAGSAGTPALDALGGSLPWIGNSFTLELRNLPPIIFRAPFGILGLSNTTWSGQPLPLDLTPIGMPGCASLVSVDEIVPLVNRGGRATWTMAIPNATSLVGAHFHLQGLVVDPHVNAFGAVTSNGADCRIGAR